MLVVSGYLDGTIVRPLEKLPARKNQNVTITITDEFISDPVKKTSLRGCLQQYAKPSLRKKEKTAWAEAAAKKHEIR